MESTSRDANMFLSDIYRFLRRLWCVNLFRKMIYRTDLEQNTRLNEVVRRRFSNIAFGLVAFIAFSVQAGAQQSDSQPVIVRPGAPGEATKVLPSTTRASLPARSQKDIEFMQGMIMHHAQAVEMTALIELRSQNRELRLLGARIRQSQSDEMSFMRRWLASRGESTEMAGMDHSSHQMLMPGMLSKRQMDALKNAKGIEFDRLFLNGMIQHHEGALVMVEDMFDTAGGGQDAELFTFATDVDSGQRAEIKIMQTMLGKKN